MSAPKLFTFQRCAATAPLISGASHTQETTPVHSSSCTRLIILSQKYATLLIFYLCCATVALLPSVQQGVAAARAHADDIDGARRLREAAGLSPVHEVGQLVHAAVTEELWEGLTPSPGWDTVTSG